MLSIIVAVSENNVVGSENKLPWKLSADLKRLKSLTMGHHLIMGRRTWESLGRPLPGRKNVVITSQKDYKAEGGIVVHSLEEAIKVSKEDDEVFIFGGGKIFKEAMPLVEKIYLTKVHSIIEGDTYFPKIDFDEWNIISSENFKSDEKNEYNYSFIILEKKNHIH